MVAGTLFFLTFIGFSLPLLELWSIMMVGMVLPLILWYGLQVLALRDVARFVLFGIVLCCQGRLDSGTLTGLLSLSSGICADDNCSLALHSWSFG